MEQRSLPKEHFIFTSESVTAGHPDKLCDYISDSVLDAFLAIDPDAKVACEAAVKNNLVMVFGEIHSNKSIVYENVVRQAIKEVGYDHIDKGFDYKHSVNIIAMDKQSQEIGASVHLDKKEEDIGAGDQGLMIGYASNDTKELMPLSHLLACQLSQRITQCYQEQICNWMGPDAKVQVSIEYLHANNPKPLRAHTILISCQHKKDTTMETINKDLMEKVIQHVIPEKYLDKNTRYFINPSGSFITGGPCGDAGLTGRKIIVDSYGGWGGHGGGAFSGKDPTKVDRSAAYAARWVAKSLVANGFCERCMVQLSYGIGIAQPISIYVQTYGTVIKGYDDYELEEIIRRNFDLRPGMIIKELNLKRPIYRKTASGGHFGRNDPDFTWETSKDLSHEKKKQ